MSKRDIFELNERIGELKEQLRTIVKEGTSKGDNRKKYQKLRSRINTLNRWIKEIKEQQKDKHLVL